MPRKYLDKRKESVMLAPKRQHKKSPCGGYLFFGLILPSNTLRRGSCQDNRGIKPCYPYIKKLNSNATEFLL